MTPIALAIAEAELRTWSTLLQQLIDTEPDNAEAIADAEANRNLAAAEVLRLTEQSA